MEEIFNEEYLKEKFDTGEYAITELLILKALYKYTFLEKKTLEKAVNRSLKPRLQKPNYERNIKSLLGKAILKGSCKAKVQAAYANRECVYYYLTIPAYYFIKRGYKYLQVTTKINEDTTNISEQFTEGDIRGILAINKWHIHVTEEYSDKLIDERYYINTRVLTKKIKMPSLIRIKQGKRKTNIMAFPYPREFDENNENKKFVEIVKKLAELDNAFKHGAWENQLLVIICESAAQIDAAFRKAAEVPALENTGILYALDADVATGMALKRLYACKMDRDKVEKKYYRYQE